MTKTVRTWVISAIAILLAVIGIYNVVVDPEADHPHHPNDSHEESHL
ncbi:hypothetical protein [Halalkalibacter alkaliphilus]|uniref:Uncharacterized protein n=1 Tax=Halalkalibacter alkaliphilus TaxID=2917993 RepID=A0A9X2I600_9BACI|nr:hypothetical protein [Halalkalibacter alkaliphilus]MCL7747459.1 hypothetical protein [Halalkalibacter alkaliphilus]